MKGMKRILAMLLAVVMVVGLIPATAFAAENVLDAAIFCSDVHGSTSDLTSVLGGVKTSGVDYSSIGFVGDTCLTVANTTSIVQSALGDTNIAVMFSYAASHDTEDGADIDDAWDYSGEVEGVSKYYLVYTIRETDMQNDTTAEDDFTTWYNGLTAAQKKLPIFIMSHRPLHHRRKDNANATDWYNAISAAAKSSDIVVFWAHNHTSEDSVDTAAYYVAKNGTETITLGTTSSSGGDTVTPNFTYMNAGYINANNQKPDRLGVATTVQITANSLIFQDYNSSGAYSGSYAHNVTVEREFAAEEVTLSSIAVSGKTSYYVGDELDLTVTATYSDSTTKDVTADAALSGYDLSTAGTQTVTATYEGKTATTSITVNEVQLNAIAVTTQPTKTTYITGEALDTTGMVVTATYNNGTTAEVTGWYTSAVDMTTAGEKEVTVNYAVDSITYKTTFTITVEQGVAEGVYLTGIEITSKPTKTEYLLSQELDLDGMVVVATFSDGSTVELQYKPFSTSTIYGGYELDNFSMYVEKAHALTVTYTYGEVTCTASTTINVWNEDFTDETTGVKVSVADADYGVTAVNVAESANTNVEAAIGNYISTDNYKAWDITLTLDADGNYALTNGEKTVTLPIPENVTNPVVCYVSEDGLTVDQMDITNNGDGTVSFETNHFSIYVIGDSAEDPEKDLTLGGTTTTTKTVYVLTSSISSGNEYLIVNGNSAGDGYYALANNNGTVAATGVTIKTDSSIGTYIELDDATDELWTVAGNYTFECEDGYLYRASTQNTSTYVPRINDSSTTWSYSTSNRRLSYTRNNSTYYLYYSNGWKVSTSSSNASSIYFYVPTEVEVTVDSSTTYEVTAENIEHIYSAIGATGETEALTYELLANGTATSFTGEVWTVKVVSDPSGIIDTENSTNETLYFTGVTGTATMRVYYELDGDNDGAVGGENDYKVWTTFTVTASNPYYSINLHKANISFVEEDITAFAEGVTYYTYDSTTETYVKVAADAEFDSTATYYTVSATVGDEITDIITRKNVKAGDTYSVWAVIKEHNAENPDGDPLGDVEDSRIYWTVSDTSIATIDPHTGVITFTGNNYGTITVTARYLGEDGKTILCEDSITISVSATSATVPSDGTDDFPEYPNEGAVRHDKTATAVGNFSETGIAKVELSMTGVPYTTGSEIDVVVMLDMTGSMSENGMAAAVAAAKAFVTMIVQNTDKTYNENRVAVYQFNSSGIGTYFDLQTISSDAELTTALGKIVASQSSGGTPFDDAAKQCYDVLQAAKKDGTGNDRQQFCVFMSDGGPTAYYGSDEKTYYNSTGNNSSGDVAIENYLTGYTSSDSADWAFTLPTEYYTDAMKADDVTVYTVGLLLQNVPSSPKPYSSMTSSTYDSDTDSLTTIGSHYYFTSEILKQMASDESKYIDIFNVDNASKATAAFESIAKDILAAATDVTVADKIGSDYTMVFDAPNAVVDAADGGQEYYIEVIDYELVPVYADDGETITDYTRGTATSQLKLYFGYNDSTGYYAATDASGTKAATPVFEKVTLGDKGTKFYWTTDSSLAGEGAISVVGADSVTYYFYSAGMSNTAEDFDSTKWYNMTSGAYASGTNTTVTLTDEDGTVTTSATCQNMIIASPYFVYNAATKMLIWTIDEISSSEMTLTYFLYLNNSGGFSGTDEEIDPATYTTNQFAYVNYTNFNKKECQLDFPVPQMTWNGAQVSYVFYLVNAAGQPVNRAGRVVPFSEAVYVTDVYTYAIIWNDLEQSAGLDAERLAEELVPEVYELYDNDAAYSIHVYEDTEKSNLNNHFVISGDVTDADYSVAKGYTNAKTTYVFNTKADANKYNIVGAYVADDGDNTEDESGLTYWCKDYNVTGTFEKTEHVHEMYGTYYTYEVTSATYNGTQTQIAEDTAGVSPTGASIIDGKLYYVDSEEKIYTIVAKTDGNEVEAGFDFHNTTVAFAVVWKPQLEEDVVVIDYGLDVVIDVIANDGMAAGVTGVMMDAPSNVTSEGTYDTSVGAASINSTDDLWTASKENLTSVRFHMNEMGINAPVSFYYEAGVNYYPVGSDTLKSTNMYSKVTVIPATTVYYEDSFVSFSENWSVEGTTSNKTQAVDRPGVNKLSDTYDADNVYGYDAAYGTYSTYSLGSAHKVHVDANSYGTATFTFWGTGFDVIGMTSGDTGVLAVKVEDANGNKVASKVVNTYYGYAYGLHKITYTYTCVQEADETAGTEAVYSWLKTGTEAVTAADTNGEPTANPKVGDTYVVYTTGWYPNATDNALYQVPVMQASGLDYGKYTVTITATYAAALDQTASEGYDLYLDAIRIYDPTGVVSGSGTNDTDGIVSDAYLADGEAWPTYIELRDQIISAKDFNAEEEGQQTTGAIFIDQAAGVYTIDDYTGYGPNNELYLANGQAIAFNVADATAAKDVQLGIKLASGDPVTYTINGDSYTVSTATDMYYSILEYAEAGTVVIQNVSGGILSLTNIKVTEAATAEATSLLWMDGETATFALMSLRRAPADTDDSSSGDTTDTETEDSVTDGNTNTGNTTGDNTNTEAEDTVTGETNAPEVDNTVTEGNGTDDTTTNEPAEDIPVEEIPEEDTPAEEETTEEPAEQLGFWARLWNAIKNAFNRLFSWFGF